YNKFGRTYLFDIDFWYIRKEVEDWEVTYTVDAYHAGNFTRFLNHSCDPNCSLVPCYINEGNIEKPLLTVFTRRDVEAYEELCFSYTGPPDEDEVLQEEATGPSMPDHDDAIYVPCKCGARNCKGRMF
ncbi:SET domain-containing protein, partial [Gloeophyllum trabeum ATCC 11539]